MSSLRPDVPQLQGGRIVIVGGGVVGLSVAWHLSDQGYTEITVVERAGIGEGATAKATGGIRQQFSTDVNIAMSRYGVDFYARFAERLGEPLVFRQHGYLFLLDRREQLSPFRAAVGRQRNHGVPARLLAPDEIAELMPAARTDDLVGASYCPTDGSASPADAVAGFARRARNAGVVICQQTGVTGIRRNRHGAVSGVDTTAGGMDAEAIVIAAGPQSAAVAALAGFDAPVEPHSRQAFSIGPLPWLTADLPLSVDLGSGAYLHPESDGGVIGGADRNAPISEEARVDWSRTDDLIAALVSRFPGLADAEVRSGWAGLREMTPDDHALLGPVESVPGLWLAAGFSGHGFMHAPAAGAAVAGLLLTGHSPVDVAALHPGRFAAGRVIEESAVF
ncbi:MAG: NAD(P)/FAD-dependent oxidoreductase [Egibacteraceae bacterium]